MNEYNGYTNYETWNVSLWIDNEEQLYRNKCTMLQAAGGAVEVSEIESFCRYEFPEGTPDMDSVYDMDRVNWQEIRDLWVEEI